MIHKERRRMTETENIALSYLPSRLAEAVRKTLSLWNTPVSEIRLREKRQLSVTIGGKNVTCEMLCTREELQQTVAAVCGNSLYSHSDSIREGCITTDCGIRVGICGHAVTADGHVSMVRDITSLNLRIPHRIPGAADELFRRMQNFPNVLIYSSPGKGKTTVLRELIPLLSSGVSAKRCAVIDTRYELCAGITNSDLTDVFYGYPRYEGILSAVRTMSPEYIICDEISTEQDANALICAHTAGVSVCASIHAGDSDELFRIPIVKMLTEARVFDLFYGIPENHQNRREELCLSGSEPEV